MFELLDKKKTPVLYPHTCQTFTVFLLQDLNARFDVEPLPAELIAKYDIILRVPHPCSVSAISESDPAAYNTKVLA